MIVAVFRPCTGPVRAAAMFVARGLKREKFATRTTAATTTANNNNNNKVD